MRHDAARREAPDAAMYTPDVDTTDDARETKRAGRWLRAWVRPTEIAVGIALLMGGLSLAGFHYEPPAGAIASEAVNRAKADTGIVRSVDSLRTGLARIDHRQDTLSDRLTFMNFLLCLQARTSPTPLGANARRDCETIIQQRLAP